MHRLKRTTSSKFSNYMPYIVCGLAACFYLYEYALQVAPSVMTQELMRDLHVDAAGLGGMAAFYYYAYSPMQIPAGMLFDRYGPRLLITLAIIACALGAVFFSLTTSVALASLGRFLMGIGSAFSFVGALILISRWFEPQYFAMLGGVAQLMSSIGALSGQVPLAAAADHFGWRNATMFYALIGFVLALVVWNVVRDYPPEAEPEEQELVKEKLLAKLSLVCSKPQTWFIGASNFMLWAPIAVFGALWGVPYLMALYHVNATVASGMVSLVWIGVGVGSPTVGWLSDRINKRCLPIVVAAILGAVSISTVLYLPPASMTWMSVLLFLLGLASSSQIITFALVKENNQPGTVGTACGFNNMATLLGGALFQPLVGYILRYTWDGKIINSIPVYSPESFQQGMIILPVVYLIAALVMFFFVKETQCKSQV